MNTKNWFVKNVIVLALLSIVTACGPQGTNMSSQEVESMLIAKEQQKWDMFRAGTFSQVTDLYADDFINIGASPAGTFRQNKQEAIGVLASLPPMDGEITLSDFLVTHPDENTAVVSYKVAAFFGSEFATAVWSQRDGEWVTVFYQGTPILDPAPPVTDAPTADVVPTLLPIENPFLGRYKTDRADSGKDAFRFTPDGGYAVDSGANGQYGTTGKFEITGNLITFTDDRRSDVPECTGESRIGTYQFTFTGNTLTFTKVDDNCVERVAYCADREWVKQ